MKKKQAGWLASHPAPLLGPVPCGEEREGSPHLLLKQGVSIPLPLSKDQATLPGAAGAERSLRRLGRGEGLPALPRGESGVPWKGVGWSALVLEAGRGPAQHGLLLGRPSHDRSRGEERGVLAAACSDGKQILLLSFSHKKLRRLHVPKTCRVVDLSFTAREIASWNCPIHVYLNGFIK